MLLCANRYTWHFDSPVKCRVEILSALGLYVTRGLVLAHNPATAEGLVLCWVDQHVLCVARVEDTHEPTLETQNGYGSVYESVEDFFHDPSTRAECYALMS